MEFPVDALRAVSPSELEQWAQKCMTELLYSNPDNPEQLTLPDSTQVDISISTVGLVPLYGCCDSQKVLALFAPADPFTPAALYLVGQWWSVRDILRTADSSRDGLLQVETLGEKVVLYVLNRVVYRVQEMSDDELPFLCHGGKDFAKILWQNGEAIGFYSVKPTGSSCSSMSCRTYPLPVLDSMFVRKSQRGRGLGLLMLEDYVDSFKDDHLGLKYPLTTAMYKVCQRYLEAYPGDAELLWEVDSSRINQKTCIANKLQNMSLRGVSRTLTFTEQSSVTEAVLQEETMEEVEVAVVKSTKGAGSRSRSARLQATEEQCAADIRITEEVTLLRSEVNSKVVQTEELLEMTKDNGKEIVLTELEDSVYDKVTSLQGLEEGTMTSGSGPEDVSQNLNTICSTVITVENVASEVEECSHMEEHPTGEDSSLNTAPLQTAVTAERVLRTRTVVNIPQPSTVGDTEGESEMTKETKDEESAAEEMLLHREPLRGQGGSISIAKPSRVSARLKKGQESAADDEDTQEAEPDGEQIFAEQNSSEGIVSEGHILAGEDLATDITQETILEVKEGDEGAGEQCLETRILRSGVKTAIIVPTTTTRRTQLIAEETEIVENELLQKVEQAETDKEPEEVSLPQETEEANSGDVQSLSKDSKETPETANVPLEAPLTTTIQEDNTKHKLVGTKVLGSGSKTVGVSSTLRTTRSSKLLIEEEIVETMTNKRGRKSTGIKRVSRSQDQPLEQGPSSAEEEEIDEVNKETPESTEKETPSPTEAGEQIIINKEGAEDVVAEEEIQPIEKNLVTTEEERVVETGSADTAEEGIEEAASAGDVESVPLITTEAEKTEHTKESLEMAKESQPESVPEPAVVESETNKEAELEFNVEDEQSQKTDLEEKQEETYEAADVTDEAFTPSTTGHEESLTDTQDEEVGTRVLRSRAKTSAVSTPRTTRSGKLLLEVEDVETAAMKQGRKSTGRKGLRKSEEQPEEQRTSSAEEDATEDVHHETVDLKVSENKEASLLEEVNEEIINNDYLSKDSENTVLNEINQAVLEKEIKHLETKEPEKDFSEKEVEEVQGETDITVEEASAVESIVVDKVEEKIEEEASIADVESVPLSTTEAESIGLIQSPLELDKETQLKSVIESALTESETDKELETESLTTVAEVNDSEDTQTQTKDSEDTLKAVAAEVTLTPTKKKKSLTSSQHEVISKRVLRSGAKTASVISTPRTTRSGKRLFEDKVVETATPKQGRKSTGGKRLSRSMKESQEQNTSSAEKDEEVHQITSNLKTTEIIEMSLGVENDAEMGSKENSATNSENLESNNIKESAAEEENDVQELMKPEKDSSQKDDEEEQGEIDTRTEEVPVVESTSADTTEEKIEDASSTADVESVPHGTTEGETTELADISLEINKTSQTECVTEPVVAEAETDKGLEPESLPKDSEEADTEDAQSQIKALDVTPDAVAIVEEDSLASNSLEERLETPEDMEVGNKVLRSGAKTASVVLTPRSTRSKKHLLEEEVVETATSKQGRKSTGRKRVSRAQVQIQEQGTSSAEEDASEELQKDAEGTENKETSPLVEFEEKIIDKDEPVEDAVLKEIKESQAEKKFNDQEPVVPEKDILDTSVEEVQDETDITQETVAVEEIDSSYTAVDVDAAPLITAETEDIEQPESCLEMDKESQPESIMEPAVAEAVKDKEPEPESLLEEQEEGIENKDIQSQTKDETTEEATSTEEASLTTTRKTPTSTQDEEVGTRVLRSGAKRTTVVSTPRITRSGKRLFEDEVVEIETMKRGRKSTGRKQKGRSKVQPQEQRTSSAEEDATEEVPEETSDLTATENKDTEEIVLDKADIDSENVVLIGTNEAVVEEKIKDQEPTQLDKDTADKDGEEVHSETDVPMEEEAIVKSASTDAEEEKSEEGVPTGDVDSIPLSTSERENIEMLEASLQMDKESQPESVMETCVAETETDKEPEPDSLQDEPEDADTQDVQYQLKDPEEASEAADVTEEASLTTTHHEESPTPTQDEEVGIRLLRSKAKTVVLTPRTTRSRKILIEEAVVETVNIKQARKSTGRKQAPRTKEQPQEERPSSAEEDTTEELHQETSENTDNKPTEEEEQLNNKIEPVEEAVLIETQESEAEKKIKDQEPEKETSDKADEVVQGDTDNTMEEAADVESVSTDNAEKTEGAASTADVEPVLITAETEDTEQTDRDSQPESAMEPDVVETETDKEPEPESLPDEAEAGNRDVQDQTKHPEEIPEAADITDEASLTTICHEESPTSTQEEEVGTRTLRSGAKRITVVSTSRNTRSGKRLFEEEVVETAPLKKGRKSVGRKQVGRSKEQRTSSVEEDASEEVQETSELTTTENRETSSQVEIEEEMDKPAKDSGDVVLNDTNEAAVIDEVKDMEPTLLDKDTSDKDIEEVQSETDITNEEAPVVISSTADVAEEKTEAAMSMVDVESIPLSTSNRQNTEAIETSPQMDKESELESEMEPDSLPEEADNKDVQYQTKDPKEIPDSVSDAEEESLATASQEETLTSTQDEVIEARIVRSKAKTASAVSTPRTTRSRKSLVEEAVVETVTSKQSRKSTGRKRATRAHEQPQEERPSSAEEHTTEELHQEISENKENKPTEAEEQINTEDKPVEEAVLTETKESEAEKEIKDQEPMQSENATLGKGDEVVQGDSDNLIEEAAAVESASAAEKTEEAASAADVEPIPQITSEAEETEQLDRDSQPESVMEPDVVETEIDKDPEPEFLPDEAEAGNSDVQDQTKDSEETPEETPEAVDVTEEASLTTIHHEESPTSTQEEEVGARTLRSGAKRTTVASTPRNTRSGKRLFEDEVVETATMKRGRKSAGRKQIGRSKEQPQEERPSSAEEDATEQLNQEISEHTENKLTEAEEQTIPEEEPAEEAVLTNILDKRNKELQDETDVAKEEAAVVESGSSDTVENKTVEIASTADVESVLIPEETEDTEQNESSPETDKESQPESEDEVVGTRLLRSGTKTTSVASTLKARSSKRLLKDKIVKTANIKRGRQSSVKKQDNSNEQPQEERASSDEEDTTEEVQPETTDLKSTTDIQMSMVEDEEGTITTNKPVEDSENIVSIDTKDADAEVKNQDLVLPENDTLDNDEVQRKGKEAESNSAEKLPSLTQEKTIVKDQLDKLKEPSIEGSSLPRVSVVLVDVKEQLVTLATQVVESEDNNTTEEVPNQEDISTEENATENETETSVADLSEAQLHQDNSEDSEAVKDESIPGSPEADNIEIEETEGENSSQTRRSFRKRAKVDNEGQTRRSSRKIPRVDYTDQDDNLDSLESPVPEDKPESPRKHTKRTEKIATESESEDEQEESDSLILSLHLDEDEEQSASDEELVVITGINLRNRAVPSIIISPHSTPQRSTTTGSKESPNQSPRKTKRRSAKASPVRTSKRHRN